jgi:hypothetical protein
MPDPIAMIAVVLVGIAWQVLAPPTGFWMMAVVSPPQEVHADKNSASQLFQNEKGQEIEKGSPKMCCSVLQM